MNVWMYRYDKWMDDEIDIKEYADRQKTEMVDI